MIAGAWASASLDEGERLMRSVRARRTTWLANRLSALEPAELNCVDAALPALARLVESDV